VSYAGTDRGWAEWICWQLGGVGKTQLAVEYAHRHAADYRLVWWIDAEQAALIGEKIAALAGPVGLTPTGAVIDDAAAVLDRLRRRDDWLLIYDNAETATAVRPWLPHGPGHVLVTSRSPGWGQLAAAVGVDVLDRPESLALLTRRVPGLDAATADALAAELGDLPPAARPPRRPGRGRRTAGRARRRRRGSGGPGRRRAGGRRRPAAAAWSPRSATSSRACINQLKIQWGTGVSCSRYQIFLLKMPVVTPRQDG
jgi:hypothetical protein